MSLRDILDFRRATRSYKKEDIDADVVRECLKMAQMAPTSSNMQLYEFYHITDKNVIKALGEASLSQSTATTANQMVVMLTRQDLHKERAKDVLNFEIENVKKNSPEDRWANRIDRYKLYYGKVMPLMYSRFLGLIGLFRVITSQITGLMRPITRQVSEGDVNASVQQSLGIVADTFMLAMAEKGYDTCPIGGFDSLRVKKILNLPKSSKVAMLISCGLRDENGVWGDRFRVDFDKIYHHI